MLSSTIDELVVGQSAPLTIDVDAETAWPSALQALVDGSVGGGVVVLGAAGPPPHADAINNSSTTSIPKRCGCMFNA